MSTVTARATEAEIWAAMSAQHERARELMQRADAVRNEAYDALRELERLAPGDLTECPSWCVGEGNDHAWRASLVSASLARFHHGPLDSKGCCDEVIELWDGPGQTRLDQKRRVSMSYLMAKN